MKRTQVISCTPSCPSAARWRAAVSAVSYLVAATPLSAEERVIVDYAIDGGAVTYRAAGFLHGMSATQPPAGLVDPLKPKMFRAREYANGDTGGAFDIYARAAALGAHIQLVVSDSWPGYANNTWPGDGGDYTSWETLVRNLVRKAKNAGMTFHWDIWNEPDIGMFWGRTRDQFFETWRRGYLRIRSTLPAAVIVGPSLSMYSNPSHLFSVKDFLVYAKANHVLPDVLSWHEWSAGSIEPDVADARAFMAANGIEISRISINEILTQSEQTSPGIVPWYHAALEAAGVDSAAHSCWADESSCACWNCWTATLSGLTTLYDRRSRSAWWAFKGYADLTGRLVHLTRSATVSGLAALDVAAHESRIVLGRNGGSTETLRLELRNLDHATELFQGATDIAVEAYRIPDNGFSELAGPLLSVHATVAVRQGRATVDLPNFAPTDAYTVRVTFLPLSSDVDHDGVPNAEDNCPVTSNADQRNSDADAFGDVCDNCPLTANPDQSDENADDIGDACAMVPPLDPAAIRQALAWNIINDADAANAGGFTTDGTGSVGTLGPVVSTDTPSPDRMAMTIHTYSGQKVMWRYTGPPLRTDAAGMSAYLVFKPIRGVYASSADSYNIFEFRGAGQRVNVSAAWQPGNRITYLCKDVMGDSYGSATVADGWTQFFMTFDRASRVFALYDVRNHRAVELVRFAVNLDVAAPQCTLGNDEITNPTDVLIDACYVAVGTPIPVYDLLLAGRPTFAPADLDQDGDADGADLGVFGSCFNGTGRPVTGACLAADLNGDSHVDGADYGTFAACFNGSGNPPACR